MKVEVTENGNYPSDEGVEVIGKRTIVLEAPAATVALQIQNGSGGWQTMTDGTFALAADKNIEFHTKQRIRFNVTNWTAPFSIVF